MDDYKFLSPRQPQTLHELAQQSVDIARAKYDFAAIDLAAALDRQRLVMSRPDRPLAPPEDAQEAYSEINIYKPVRFICRPSTG